MPKQSTNKKMTSTIRQKCIHTVYTERKNSQYKILFYFPIEILLKIFFPRQLLTWPFVSNENEIGNQ